MSYWDLSSANPDREKSIEGTKSDSFSRLVQVENEVWCCASFVLWSADDSVEGPLVVVTTACFEARIFECKALTSSTFDFSEAGRRIIEGPPLMILLAIVSQGLLTSRDSPTRWRESTWS